MKTKFSQILRLKQNIVNKIEFEIMQVNGEIAGKKRAIAELERLISEFVAPKKSERYSEFLNFRDALSNIRAKIAEERNFLAMMEARKVDILKRFKVAKIEFEKINYLHLQEVQAILKKAQRTELIELNEIATNKYLALKKVER